MNPFILFPFCFFGGIVALVILYYFIRFINAKTTYKQLVDFHDCPFKFRVTDNDYSDYVVFDLGGIDLYCKYEFGIRRDGIFGVSELKLCGFNSPSGSHIRLDVGQSIFPLLENIKQFEEWAYNKTFNACWDSELRYVWSKVLKGIDNLSFLETKSKENDDTK